GRPQQQYLARGEPVRGRAGANAGHVGRGIAHRLRHVLVMAPLVLAAAVVRHTQDHQLGVTPRQLPSRHQPPREHEPGQVEPAVAREGREQPRELGAPRGALGDPRDQRVQWPDLLRRAGWDSCAHPIETVLVYTFVASAGPSSGYSWVVFDGPSGTAIVS